ncbi:MAG: glycosyltransferase family 39 protein [Thermomicrobiales bacterium]
MSTETRQDEAAADEIAALPDVSTDRGWSRLWSRRADADDDDAFDDEAELTHAGAWAPIVVGAILVVGLLARLSAAEHISPQIDEAASVMAAHMVVERGLPIFPSDIPYTQGATLSYALAPFVALGVGDLDDLYAMRLLSVVVGLLTLYFTYRLGRELSGEAWVGAVAAGLLAIDPVSIQWGGHVRMYAPLQLAAVVVTLLFARVILVGPTRRRLAGIVVVFWLGIFTHLVTGLLWPAMALVALSVYGRRLRDERRDLTVALGLTFIAPFFLFALNQILGPSDRAASQTTPFISFVGDHLLAASSILNPTFQAWELLFRRSALIEIMPFVMAAVSCLLAGRYFLSRDDEVNGRDRKAIGIVLSFYWFPILLVGTLVNDAQDRYVIHVQAFGVLLAALVMRELVALRPAMRGVLRWQARTFRSVGLALLALLLTDLGSGLYHLNQNTVPDPDYIEGAQYVAARRESGEPVFAGLPTAPYLAFDSAEELYFLPGPYDRNRVKNYTRDVGDHQYIDYWAGVPAIVSVDQLCRALIDNPDAWLIVDTHRLNASWAYAGDMANVIRGLTYVRYVGTGSVEVRGVAPLPSRDAHAELRCRKAAELPPPWVLEEQQQQREERMANQ